MYVCNEVVGGVCGGKDSLVYVYIILYVRTYVSETGTTGYKFTRTCLCMCVVQWCVQHDGGVHRNGAKYQWGDANAYVTTE
jgi:hypothetical protein